MLSAPCLRSVLAKGARVRGLLSDDCNLEVDNARSDRDPRHRARGAIDLGDVKFGKPCLLETTAHRVFVLAQM